MPGLNIVISSSLDHKALLRALADLQSDYSSQVKVLYKDALFALVFSGHEGYPKWFYEDENHVVLLEGMIYNYPLQKIVEKILQIAAIFSTTGDVKADIKEFVDCSDGDFLCLIYSKHSSSFLLFNDRFGRLPTFYHKSSNFFALSREIKFILHFMPEISIDRFGLAYFLMFEHTIGDKTLFKNIKRIHPSHFVKVRLETKSSSKKVEFIYNESVPLNFDETNRISSKKKCIEKVKSLFLESLKNRYSVCNQKGYSCIADVSGGFDTRTVVMGLEKLGLDVDYFTHILVTGDESKVAENIVNLYCKEVKLVSASHDIDYNEMENIIYATDCMVNGWTALTCWKDLFLKSKMTEGKTACIMGFGGEFIRHPFLPAPGYRSLQSMLRANILKTSMNSETSSFLSGIPYETYIKSLENHFENYTEKTLVGKLKHFYFEYYFLPNAGEDRTRRLFWTVQPLLGKDLYEFEVHAVPLKFANFSFYTNVLRSIDPKVLKVPVYGININLESKINIALYDLYMKLRAHTRTYILGNQLTNKMFTKMKGKKISSPAYINTTEILTQVHQSLNKLSKYISKKQIDHFISHEYNIINLNRLLSVLMYFKKLEEHFSDKLHVN